MDPLPADKGGVTLGALARAPRGAADRAISRTLLEAITDHRLPPGTPLPEDRLALAFGCSRTIIRQAMRLLVHEKLVEHRPNRTAAVARPSFDEARDIFAARAMVEVPLVATAVRRAQREDLAALERNLAEERIAIAAGDRRAQLRLSGEFHRLIAAIAGNRVLAGFIGQLVSRSALILALYEPAVRPSCASADHSALLAAITGRESERAQRLMAAHLAQLEQDLAPMPAPRAIDFAALFSFAARGGKARARARST